jgi:hypothetical protein
MVKKTFIFSGLAFMLFLAPRFADTSSANYYYGQNTAGFILTSNNNFCVGQTPVYNISNGPANAAVTWISYGPSGQTQTSFTLSNTGNFSGNGNAWQNSDIGSWTKMAVIDGVAQSLQLQVINCGQTSITGNNANSSTSGNVYYDPYNNILQPLGSGGTNSNSYEAPGNTYYDPYNNDIFAPLGQPSGTVNNNNNQNTNSSNNNNYMAPGNTYYNPYGNVPCLTSSC